MLSEGTVAVKGRVSVVIPTYNFIHLVRETLESVMVQDYADVEVVVTDDCSTDGTQEVLKEFAARYPAKLKLILEEKNVGMSGNCNRGLEATTGEFIAWLGGDDVMFPGKISRQVDLLSKRPDAAFCCHDAEVFDTRMGKVIGKYLDICPGKRGLREGGIELLFDPLYPIIASSVMFRSSFCPPQGMDVRLRGLGDWLFFVELVRHGKFLVINEPLVRYRRHATNISYDPANMPNWAEEWVMVLAILELRYPELRKLARRRRRHLFLQQAGRACALGQWARFRAFCAMAIREGALLRGTVFFLGMPLLKNSFASALNKAAEERPKWYAPLYRLIMRS